MGQEEMARSDQYKFETEAELCRTFLSMISDDWTAYNETGGFDILLAHRSGVQIGVEAKLSLNSKVLVQVVENRHRCWPSPDFRAVLVGRVVAENAALARELGVTVIQVRGTTSHVGRSRKGPTRPAFSAYPDLPKLSELTYIPEGWRSRWLDRGEWFDEAPTERLPLPDYVPDVEAGHPSPMTLSDWKIKAIKVCIFVERRTRIDRATFKKLVIDPSRWMDGRWLQKSNLRGYWVAGKAFPAAQFRREHPRVFAEIEADFEQWSKEL